MAVGRFETFDPKLTELQPLEYVSKLPGELLFKAGAVQQERFDKVGKGIEDTGDLLNIKVDPKDIPDLKKRQTYYNDRLSAVAKNMAEGKTTTSKAAVDLLDIKKEMVKDDFLNMAPVNYENKLKAQKREQELESTGKVSAHNKVFQRDYDNWPGTIDPNTQQVNMFSSAGAYINDDYRSDLEAIVDNVKAKELGTVKPNIDGTMTSTKIGKITRDQLIQIMSPALEDFNRKHEGELTRRKDFYGKDDLGTLDLIPITKKNKAGKDVISGYDWANKGLLASVIDERLLDNTFKDIQATPNWSAPAPKKEDNGYAPITSNPAQSAYIYETVKNYEDFKSKKDSLLTSIQQATAAGKTKEAKTLSNRLAAMEATETKFFLNWLDANPTEKAIYEEKLALSKSTKPEDNTKKIVYIGGNPQYIIPSQLAKEQIQRMKDIAFQENSVFDQYFKANTRSETPTLISLPGMYSTQTSSTKGEIEGMKYIPTNDILTKNFRLNPLNYTITNMDGSTPTSPVETNMLVLTQMQRVPSPDGKILLTGNLLDDEGNITGTQYRVMPKNTVTEGTVKNLLKKGYGDMLDKKKDSYGNVIGYEDNDKLQAFLDVIGFDIYQDLIASREPNSTNYSGETTINIDEGPFKGKKIDVLVVSDNADEEFSKRSATYVLNYTDPSTGDNRQVEVPNATLKDVSDELSKLLIALKRAK